MLRESLAEHFAAERKRRKALIERAGDMVLDKVTVAGLFGGVRQKVVPYDSSRVSPQDGVTICGLDAMQLAKKSPAETFLMLLLCRIPTVAEVAELISEVGCMSPATADDITRLLDACPKGTHPMTLLNVGLAAIQNQLQYPYNIPAGVKKEDLWKVVYNDVLKVFQVLPFVAALACDIGSGYPPCDRRSWQAYYPKAWDYAVGFAEMVRDCNNRLAFQNVMGSYLSVHASHEGGNASIFTSRVVGAAHAGVVEALTGGASALAGVLHGAASQEVLLWLQSIHAKYPNGPSDAEIEGCIIELRQAGQVVPGFGHAVLRSTDARATALLKLGESLNLKSPLFDLAKRLYQVGPDMVTRNTPAKSPYPNVDLMSGSILHSCGFKNPQCYTVVFALARALDMAAQLIRIHGLGEPLVRPASVTVAEVEALVEQQSAPAETTAAVV